MSADNWGTFNTGDSYGRVDGRGRLSAAVEDFRDARRQAALYGLLAKVRGRNLDLLSFNQVTDQLRIAGQSYRGLQEIPVERIVGSVGRFSDFDRCFFPLQKSDEQRWASLRAAAPDLGKLPPIDVYQIDDAYFVIDGNHRVSLARLEGVESLPANVIEVRTRAPLPADLDPFGLVMAAEYAAFLEHTRLDHLRRHANVQLSIPGRYGRLEDHIEAHRQQIEAQLGREISYEDAVTRWYDDVYLPIVGAIREQGILRDFPGRTEADLYLWIAENQAQLASEMGWQARPEMAVSELKPAADPEPKKQSVFSRLYRQVLADLVPERLREAPATREWAQQRVLDRYSRTLFLDILVVLDEGTAWPGLHFAARIAQADGARMHGLLLREASAEEATALKGEESPAELFSRRLEEWGLKGDLQPESGDYVDSVAHRVLVADLAVVDRPSLLSFGKDTGDSMLHRLLEQCVRPVLFVPGATAALRRVLLVHDARPQAQEGLFVATYMAEQWGVELFILADPAAGAAALEAAEAYLELHEVQAAQTIAAPLALEEVLAAAREHRCDLVITAGYREEPLSKAALAAWLFASGDESDPPLFICP